MLAMSDDGWVESRRFESDSPGVRGSGFVGLDLGRGEGVMLLRGLPWLACLALGMKTLRKDPDGWYLNGN